MRISPFPQLLAWNNLKTTARYLLKSIEAGSAPFTNGILLSLIGTSNRVPYHHQRKTEQIFSIPSQRVSCTLVILR